MFNELKSPSCIILYTVNGFPSLNAAAPHNLHTGCQLQNVIIFVRVYIWFPQICIYCLRIIRTTRTSGDLKSV